MLQTPIEKKDESGLSSSLLLKSKYYQYYESGRESKPKLGIFVPNDCLKTITANKYVVTSKLFLISVRVLQVLHKRSKS